MKRALFFIALGGIVLALLWSVWRRPAVPPRHRVTATIASITNDSSGIRHVTIRVANGGRSPVTLLALYGLENRLGLWRTNAVPRNGLVQNTNMMGLLPFHPRARSLRPGEAYEVTLVLPFEDSGWRASFWHVDTQPPLLEFMQYWSRRLGLAKDGGPQLITHTKWAN